MIYRLPGLHPVRIQCSIPDKHDGELAHSLYCIHCQTICLTCSTVVSSTHRDRSGSEGAPQKGEPRLPPAPPML